MRIVWLCYIIFFKGLRWWKFSWTHTQWTQYLPIEKWGKILLFFFLMCCAVFFLPAFSNIMQKQYLLDCYINIFVVAILSQQTDSFICLYSYLTMHCFYSRAAISERSWTLSWKTLKQRSRVSSWNWPLLRSWAKNLKHWQKNIANWGKRSRQKTGC